MDYAKKVLMSHSTIEFTIIFLIGTLATRELESIAANIVFYTVLIFFAGNFAPSLLGTRYKSF